MIEKHALGKQGEMLAADYLSAKGYEILEKNWRFRKAEVDLICKYNNTIVFVEVKTKSYTFFGQPEDSITERKEELLVFAAFEYIQQIEHLGDIRFDVVSIVISKSGKHVIKHFLDVIDPGLV